MLRAKPIGVALLISFYATTASAAAGAVGADGGAADAPVPGNRVAEFCRAAPAPTVVRAKLHADSDLAHVVEVECVYGANDTTTDYMAQRFLGTPEDETLLVSLTKDGNVVGTAWPVFKEKVSLEFGIPDMSEAEAVTLLQSTKCQDDLRAFRDHGVHPVAAKVSATPTGGCAHCSTAPTDASNPSSLISVIVLVLATVFASRRRVRRHTAMAGSARQSASRCS